MKEMSLYIHFPWCEKRCSYCDFNAHAISSSGIDEKIYIEKLLQDLDQDLELAHEHFGDKLNLHSIFLGGGTPSLFSPKSINYLLNKISSRISFQDTIEITIECNPNKNEANLLKDFRYAGINRLSLGIQSFSDIYLQKLDRIHRQNDTKKSIENAQKYFQNFNLDIMFALSEQSVHHAVDDLSFAIDANPTHISWYQLSVEPNSIFYSQNHSLPDPDTIVEMIQEGHALLDRSGFKRYEISAFARNGFQCKHNMNYWRYGDYLGIGAGAHGKITIQNNNNEKSSNPKMVVLRTQKTRHPNDYLKSTNLKKHRKIVPLSKLSFEILLNRLRIKESCPKSLIENHGISWKILIEKLEVFRENNLIIINDSENQNSIQSTYKGWDMMNEILISLVD